MHPECVEWLCAQKSHGMNIPEEQNLIDLLKSGKTFWMKCTYTDLNGDKKLHLLSKAPRNAVHAMVWSFWSLLTKTVESINLIKLPQMYFSMTMTRVININSRQKMIGMDKRDTAMWLKFDIERFCFSSIKRMKVVVIKKKLWWKR